MSPNDDNNDTPESHSDRESPFSFLNSSFFTDFSDHQRLERLKQCREIEHVLNRCRTMQQIIMLKNQEQELHQKKGIFTNWLKRSDNKPDNNNNKHHHPPASRSPPHYSTLELEQTVPGLRMTHYFGWRQTSAVRVGDVVIREKKQEETTREEKKETLTSCARETHCLWACRSIALGCAPYLTKLKQCFQQYENVQSVDQTAYDEKSRKNITAADLVIPCREIQEELGACVTQNALELQRRRQQKTKNAASPS
jgi:hypothetical protein